MKLRRLISFPPYSTADWVLEARLLHWLTFFWLFMGLVVLFSASYHLGVVESNDGFYYVKRQLLGMGLGILTFFFAIHIPLRSVVKRAFIGFFLFLILIFATNIHGLGEEIGGSSRWLALGPFPVQPSELIKPFLILQGAHVFSFWHRLTKGERLGWLVLFALALLGILVQPNLSTTALCGMALWLIALSAGLQYRGLLTVAFAGVALAAFSVLHNPYQQSRILSFLNPWQQSLGDGYQLSQSLLGVGSGGLIGAGYGESQLKLSYLPIQHTDFIFSVFAEEFGLLGGLFLLTFLAVFSSLAWRVAIKTNNPEHRLIAVGAMILLVGQSLINIGVVVGVLPTTGLPLPFFSYGGNSMISSLLIAALLIRVARESQNAEVLPLPHPGGGQPALIRLVGDNASVPTSRGRSGSPQRVFTPRGGDQSGSNLPASMRRHRRRSLMQRIFGPAPMRSPSYPDQPSSRRNLEAAHNLRIQALKKRRQHRLR